MLELVRLIHGCVIFWVHGKSFPIYRRVFCFNKNCFLSLTVGSDSFVFHILNMRKFSQFTMFLYSRVCVFFSSLCVCKEYRPTYSPPTHTLKKRSLQHRNNYTVVQIYDFFFFCIKYKNEFTFIPWISVVLQIFK